MTNSVIKRSALTERNLLCEDACNEISALVVGHRQSWVRRNPVVPLYTLGAAAYADGPHYRAAAERGNGLLAATFGTLLDRVAAAVGEYAGIRTRWLGGAALPGFHIYLDDPLFGLPIASIHLDRQQYQVDLSALHAPDFDAPISFTLPIALPASSSGLDFAEVIQEGEDDRATVAIAARGKKNFHAYRRGVLVLHDGMMVHQAEISRGMAPGEMRITLQGHGIRDGDTLYLYW